MANIFWRNFPKKSILGIRSSYSTHGSLILMFLSSSLLSFYTVGRGICWNAGKYLYYLFDILTSTILTPFRLIRRSKLSYIMKFYRLLFLRCEMKVLAKNPCLVTLNIDTSNMFAHGITIDSFVKESRTKMCKEIISKWRMQKSQTSWILFFNLNIPNYQWISSSFTFFVCESWKLPELKIRVKHTKTLQVSFPGIQEKGVPLLTFNL